MTTSNDIPTNLYAGEYQSAIARAKKILTSAGFPWSVKKGRYTPYFNEQTVSRGVKVTRVGCSETICIHVSGYDWNDGENGRETARWVEKLAIVTLREAGMPFDDRGWLDCGTKAARKLAAMKGAVK